MIVGVTALRQTYTQSHHHEGNLRDGREGQHTLDITLGASHSSCIKGRESTDPSHDVQRLRSILYPQGEHTGHLEHTSYHHRSSVNQGTNRSRTFHGIGQPDVEREHGALTGTTHKHQEQSRGQNETGTGNGLGEIGTNTRHSSIQIYCGICKVEAERTRIVTIEQDTDEEAQVGKTGNDECLL